MIKKIIIIVGVFALATVISFFLIDVNEKQFNQTQWNNSPITRHKMASTIVESKFLIGKTKTEVFSILGNNTKPSTLQGKDHLVYSLGKPPSFFETKEETLVVIFNKKNIIYSITTDFL